MTGFGAASPRVGQARDACLSPKDQMWAVCKRSGMGSPQILTKSDGPRSGVLPRRRKLRAGGVPIERKQC